MRHLPLPLVALLLFPWMATARAQAPLAAPPATPIRPVTDSFHNTAVVDPYRWLESADAPEVRSWTAAQNARTRAFLDKLPALDALKTRLRQLITASSPSYYALEFRGNHLFAMKRQPPLQQPLLVMLPLDANPAGEKVLFDPNAVSATGAVSITFFVPSFDGRYVALALTENGSEDSAATVLDTATGKPLSDRVPRVNFATAGGSLEWNRDSTGFFYTRYPQGNERPPEDATFYQQIYFHTLGTPASADTYVLGKDFPKIAEIDLQASDDAKTLVATVANGDGGEYAHYVMNEAGQWTQVTHFADQVIRARAGTDGHLYLLSRKDAPRGKLLRVSLSNPVLSTAQTLIPEAPAASLTDAATLDHFTVSANRLYVVYLRGGPELLHVYTLEGKELPAPPQSPIGSIYQVLPLRNDILFQAATYLQPPAWFRFSPESSTTTPTPLAETAAYSFDDAEVVREFAPSKDGTLIPLNILRKKGTVLNGQNPALLTAYGGYGISLTPSFASPTARLWLDAGGIFVVANLRGGGEYGEAWHKAGNLTKKQNVFDDFAASAQYLIQQKCTSPERLAIMGGSNGGLLMGAALTQHPKLYRAVVSYVGIYDMLRVELDPNGAFNTTEFGTVQDPDQFRALYAYSPYHHVTDGSTYPAVFFLTGENDHRVNPSQSRKMTARLQAATTSSRPTLLHVSATAGHGRGTPLDEQIAQSADVLAFLFDQLAVPYPPMR